MAKHVRLRIEHQHLGGGKGYTGNLIKKSTNFDSYIGRWVGVRFLGYHESDKKRTRLVILIDNKGLTEGGKPANEWEVVVDEWDTGQWDSKVKEKVQGEYVHGTPYGKYPYENGQQTIRIDGVPGDKDLEWKFLSCRAIDPTKPLSQLLSEITRRRIRANSSTPGQRQGGTKNLEEKGLILGRFVDR